MNTAQDPKENPGDDGHRDGEDCGQCFVKYIFRQFKHCVTSYPDFVKALRRAGLRDDIVKADLLNQTNLSHTSI